ncbi:DNA-binding domain-containing protein, AraC-type [Saccharomonospora marina XMU15]|uniref:DNA-binding domain-containing protein, AraC-type n=1 Tax=Saccharomonospora marina XMU15 TaxID=882083 RepID=H5X7L7_9PSEU|nr:AraC family transcriptional regulator [Saccharomonospora marina]EHR51309.1 DNA-binding domain-containing protein, AraC-type [Saccharomonospora marina XMU15]
MRVNVGRCDTGGLESLCHHLPSAPKQGRRLRFGGGAAGIERLEAMLLGEAFAPHRHDTYAIGVTVSGVQTFRYRGEQQYCLPGEWHVLHPDEPHDGAPGTQQGFGYRIVYLDPALIQDALGGRPLPFVAEPVLRDAGTGSRLGAYLADIDDSLDELQAAEITSAVADVLARHAKPARPRRTSLDLPAMRRVRSVLLDDPTTQHPVGELERVAGLDRWTIARQFRAAFGTSPTRFRTMRRLDRARALMLAGHGLSEVAVLAGFADQSHLTRMFKRTYGLTPSAWVAATRSNPD